MLTDTERAAIFKTAARQLHQEQTPTRTEQAEQLIREALDAFIDPEARIDLREWVRSARGYLDTYKGSNRHA